MTITTRTQLGTDAPKAQAPLSRRSARHQAPADPPRAASERLRDGVVIVFGTLGIIAIAWLVVAWAFHLAVIVFVTGSMSPTMPTGSAAVVQTIAAPDLKVGDVVTVTGASSGRPVTHRIVDIAQVEGDAAARSLTLRGDANTIDDSEPYLVSEAERVVVAAPGVGWLVIWSKSPIVMIAISLCVAGTIAWGLWPSTAARPSPEAEDSKKEQ